MDARAPLTLHIDDQGQFHIYAESLNAGIGAAHFSISAWDCALDTGTADEVRVEGPRDLSLGGASATSIRLHHIDARVECALRAELSADARAVFLTVSVHNPSKWPLSLRDCEVLQGELELPGERPEPVMLACSGTTSPSRVQGVVSAPHGVASKTIAQIYGRSTNIAIHCGFVSFDRLDTEHLATTEPASIDLWSTCCFNGYELAPGESIESETLMVQVGHDSLAQLEAWADEVAERYKPRIWPKIPAGWVGWAWVDPFNVEPYESVVRRNAEAIRRRLAGHDIKYVWVSIGNIKDGIPGDWLAWNEELFPGGVEKLVGDLGKLDLKLGFWMGAFWLCAALKERVEEMRDALLEKRGEPMVVVDEWRYGSSGLLPRKQRPCIYALDPTHPQTHEFLREVLSTYHEWGVRYYMIDFLHAVSHTTPGDFVSDGFHEKTLIPGPETYRKGLQVIREAAGDDTYLLSSTGPTYQNTGFMDACRVGNDYGEGRALNPESFFYPATFVINSAGFWTSHRAATDAMAAGYFTHRKLYLADSGNVLTVDKPIPLSDAQITATIFGINGGPMMLGDDIDRMADERLALVRKCLPRLPECARPLDLFTSVEPDHPKLFHLRVERDWDTWHVVAVFNYGEEELKQPVEPDGLGLQGEYVVWGFWNERYEGTHSGPLELRVPPGSVKLVRLAEHREHPWLLSTDMHIRQGQAEIEECRWEADTMTLTVRAMRPAGEKGNVFVLAPEGLCVTNPESLWIAKDGNDRCLIIRIAFDFEGEPVERQVRFAPIGLT